MHKLVAACLLFLALILPMHLVQIARTKALNQRVEALIEKLANVSPSEESSADVNEIHNREMMSAFVELRDLGTVAFPFVIAHLGDSRKSYIFDTASAPRQRRTVGSVCFDVLWCNLEPYNLLMYWGSLPPKDQWWRPTFVEEVLWPPERAQAWFATRKNKTLLDLQIEVLEWVTSNRSKRKVDVSESDRHELLALLPKLKKDRRPLTPANPWPR